MGQRCVSDFNVLRLAAEWATRIRSRKQLLKRYEHLDHVLFYKNGGVAVTCDRVTIVGRHTWEGGETFALPLRPAIFKGCIRTFTIDKQDRVYGERRNGTIVDWGKAVREPRLPDFGRIAGLNNSDYIAEGVPNGVAQALIVAMIKKHLSVDMNTWLSAPEWEGKQLLWGDDLNHRVVIVGQPHYLNLTETYKDTVIQEAKQSLEAIRVQWRMPTRCEVKAYD